MIRELAPRIRKLAAKIDARGAVDQDDLVQSALIQVLKARPRFDPRKGASWKTFALNRARFAMLDELRELDHVPRLERFRARREGRELRRVLSMQTSPTDVVPTTIHDRGAPDPLRAAAGEDLWRELPRLVGCRRAAVLEAYYRRGMKLWEIGRAVGLSESRVCQLHAQGLRKLRRKEWENRS